LQRKSFDVIVNGLEPTGDRAQQILFSKPYYIFQLQLTVRRDNNRITSLDDCKNRVVGTLGNTAASRILQQQGIPFRSYADPVGAYRDLELKRIDAALFDVPAEAFYARSNPKLKPAGPPFTRGQYVIGLRKDDLALPPSTRSSATERSKRFSKSGDSGTTRTLSFKRRFVPELSPPKSRNTRQQTRRSTGVKLSGDSHAPLPSLF
jgi:ABC-type amino acid transport substrate-binding protein